MKDLCNDKFAVVSIRRSPHESLQGHTCHRYNQTIQLYYAVSCNHPVVNLETFAGSSNQTQSKGILAKRLLSIVGKKALYQGHHQDKYRSRDYFRKPPTLAVVAGCSSGCAFPKTHCDPLESGARKNAW